MQGTRKGVSARLRSIALAALVLGPLMLATVNPHPSSADVPDPAARFAVGSPQMLAAEQIARDTWGFDPCGGQVNVSWAVLGPSFNATSTWTNATDPYANPTANYDCSIVFNSAMSYDWQKFCTVVVHEFGHLTGHPHVADPNNVMTPVFGVVFPACRVPEPGAPAAATPAPVSQTRAVATTKARSSRATAREKAAEARKIRYVSAD